MAYILTLVGATKLLTIILGGISYGLGVYSYDETIIKEEYFLRSVQICVIISIVYFLPHLLSNKLVTSEVNNYFDIALHVICSIALFIGTGLFLYSAIDDERTYCEILWITYPEHFCQYFKTKLAAGLTTLLNGILYSLVAAFVFLSMAFKGDTRNNTQLQDKKQIFRNYQNKYYKNDSLQPPRFSTLPKYSYYYGERF